jgi:hypothetical protein
VERLAVPPIGTRAKLPCMRHAVVLLLVLAAPGSIARACDEAAARAAAERLVPSRIAGPRPRERSSRCVQVSVSGPELGPPSFASYLRASCTSVAVAYRFTIVRAETCGQDIHFEPEHVGGVAVLELAGTSLRVRARGALDGLESLELGAPSDEDGDGRHEITRPGTRAPLVLSVRGRTVRPMIEIDASLPSRASGDLLLELALEGQGPARWSGEVVAIDPPDASGIVRVDLGAGRALRVRMPRALALPLAIGEPITVERAPPRRRDLPEDVVVRASDGVRLLRSVAGSAIAPFTISPGSRASRVRVSAGNVSAELAPRAWRELATREGRFAVSGTAGETRSYAVVRIR